MANEKEQSRFVFLVEPDFAAEFEHQLRKSLGSQMPVIPEGTNVRVARATVKGHSVDLTTVELAKIIIALGGGVGIAAIVNAIAHTIVNWIKAKRGNVKLKMADGNILELENYTSEEVERILMEATKRGNSNGKKA